MSNESNLTVADRIEQLMNHLGIEKAHFAGRYFPDIAGSLSNHPERIMSLTLVCPPALPSYAVRATGSKMLVFNGDRGPFAGTIASTLETIKEASAITFPDYVGALWDDLIVEHNETIGREMLKFLSQNEFDSGQVESPGVATEGDVADIHYLIRGSGAPLLLFPLILSPSQWEPLVSLLEQHFCTITLTGSRLGIVPGLEERGKSRGYQAMFGNLIQAADLKPGEAVLEVGPGTGVQTRWLAKHTKGENMITAVDVNNYLVGEASHLGTKEGHEDVITFRQGSGETLPLRDNSYDFAYSVTALEEGDADKMLAEMVRVTKPGGKVGVIVRAMDIPFVINLPLEPALKSKAQSFPNGVVVPKGCADASLYDRFRQAGLENVRGFPQFTAFDELSPMNLAHMLRLTFNRLEREEQAAWNDAMSTQAAKDNFFVAAPHHCAIGTKPQ